MARGTADPPYRALDDITHAQLAPDLSDVRRATRLVGKGRVPGDDEEVFDPAQRCRDLLHHRVGKVGLVGFAREVVERQHDQTVDPGELRRRRLEREMKDRDHEQRCRKAGK